MVWWNPHRKNACGQCRYFGCAETFSHHLFRASLDSLLFSEEDKGRILFKCILYIAAMNFLLFLTSNRSCQLWLYSLFFFLNIGSVAPNAAQVQWTSLEVILGVFSKGFPIPAVGELDARRAWGHNSLEKHKCISHDAASVGGRSIDTD